MCRPCSSRRPGGLTLIEALISGAVLLLVFGMGLRFLIPILKLQQSDGERVELQQRATLVLGQLEKDLHRSIPQGVSLAELEEGQTVLGIHLLENIAQDGSLVWSDQLIVYRYRPELGTLERREWSDPGRSKLRATAASKLTPSDLSQVLQRDTVLSRHTEGVAGLTVNHPGYDAVSVTFPLLVSMELESPSGLKHEVRKTIGRRIPNA